MRRIRVFVASPSDVQYERDQVAEVVQELNQILAALVPEADLVLESVGWETHVHPGLGARPQQIVNQQVDVSEQDVFIGIFWLRFGTPTDTADSGTEEEFRIAHRAWTELGRAIQIMVYFCREPSPPPDTIEAAEQLGKVVAFRQELDKEGLVRNYDDRAAFAATVRRDLVLVLGQLLNAESKPAAIASQAAERGTSDALAATREQIRELARAYDDIREGPNRMPRGNERTRRLEVVASQMRALALAAFPLLGELTRSDSPGERLAAVTVLQAIPQAEYLSWLGERPRDEKPFIGYHAALALLAAARQLGTEDLGDVEAALRVAESATSRLRPDTDRQTTLRYVAEELARRRESGR
jgi:hypothetical protein